MRTRWSRRGGMVRTAVIAALLVCAPTAARAHVTLVSSAPADDEVVEGPPTHVRVVFSGRVEPQYSALTVFAPDGSQVALGSIVFADGSDREFMAAMPPVSVPGRYTVRWRTAGADGHVLQGSFAFTLAGDTSVAAVQDTGTGSAELPVLELGGQSHQHDAGVGAAGSSGVPAVLARWLHFLALTLLVGAVTFRVVLVPRITEHGTGRADMQRRAWRTIAFAALLLAVAAVLRLWLQSAALHGPGAAWSSESLAGMLTGTGWGRAWLLQAFLFALLGAGITWARPPRDRLGLIVAAIATVGLCFIPGLTGHAAGTGPFGLAVFVDAVHVLAAGVWLGTLALLLAAAVPALLRNGERPHADIANAVHRFSPLALAGAAVVMLTGVVNSLMHLGSVSHLVDTVYGRTLLAKLAAVAVVVTVGFYHWRTVRPRLGAETATRSLRRSMAVELALAAAVLLLTAVLTGHQRP